MRETIYTIPINDAFAQEAECPVCLLRGKLDRDALEYTLSPAMMEPDVRIEINRLGFCGHHLAELMKMGNRLSLALCLESHLTEFSARTEKYLAAPDTCFICDRRDTFMAAYYRNLYHIWENDAEFRTKFGKARICAPHLSALTRGADAAMKRKSAADFKNVCSVNAKRELGELLPLVSAFCRSFDHRFADMPLGDAKTAVERSAAWLS